MSLAPYVSVCCRGNASVRLCWCHGWLIVLQRTLNGPRRPSCWSVTDVFVLVVLVTSAEFFLFFYSDVSQSVIGQVFSSVSSSAECKGQFTPKICDETTWHLRLLATIDSIKHWTNPPWRHPLVSAWAKVKHPKSGPGHHHLSEPDSA